jgi:hypothetical protein
MHTATRGARALALNCVIGQRKRLNQENTRRATDP